MAWEERREQFEGAEYDPLAQGLRSPKEGITPNSWGFYFVWERPGVGIRVWFSAHQVMDDVGQGPDNRNAEEGDAE